jgi:hypothetical protein
LLFIKQSRLAIFGWPVIVPISVFQMVWYKDVRLQLKIKLTIWKPALCGIQQPFKNRTELLSVAWKPVRHTAKLILKKKIDYLTPSSFKIRSQNASSTSSMLYFCVPVHRGLHYITNRFKWDLHKQCRAMKTA